MVLFKIANSITLCRILAIPVVIVLLARSQQVHDYQVIALLVLVLLQASDILDGFIARMGQRRIAKSNPFGRLMDPVADKLYINSITLLITHSFPVWVTATVVARDLVISTAWAMRLLVTKDKSVKPNFLGKLADSSQAVLIFAFLLNIPDPYFNYAANFTVAVTVVSGLAYLWQGIYRYLSSDRKKERGNIKSAAESLAVNQSKP